MTVATLETFADAGVSKPGGVSTVRVVVPGPTGSKAEETVVVPP